MKNSVVFAPSSTPGIAKIENRAGPLTDPVDKFGEFPPLLDFGDPALVQAGQRFCDDAAGADRIGFADPQVRGEIVRIPALAQRGCVRADLVEQVAQLSPFGPGKRHERPS